MTAPASSGSAGVNDRASWQQTLDDTVGALQSALAGNLYSVVLCGSAARGGWNERVVLHLEPLR